MISHVVLMKPRPNLPAADRAELIAAFERAVARIGSVRGVRIGRRVVHGARYEATAADADYLAIIDFDDLAGLQTYLGHAAHEELGALLGRSVSMMTVYDFESAGLEALRVGGFFQAE